MNTQNYNGSNATGSADSIEVTKLPTHLLSSDLKDLLLRHFANFGNPVRISCSKRSGAGYTGHIQFESPEQALAAMRDGGIIQGHNVKIELTKKQPKTQLLKGRIYPMAIPLASSASLNEQRQRSSQPSIKTYLNGNVSSSTTHAPKNANALSNNVPSITGIPLVDEVLAGKGPSLSLQENLTSKQVPLKQEHKPVVSHVQEDKKPNTCVKIEVYRGGEALSQSPNSPKISKNPHTPSTSGIQSSGLRGQLPSLQYPTLSQILNLDTSNMKTVRTVNSGDALASQIFTGGKYPFSLSLMFGRNPGSVIMPVRSIMDEIKPDMEIKQPTLESIWNLVLKSVLKTSVYQVASEALSREKIIWSVLSEWYDDFEAEVTMNIIQSTVEEEISDEEERMICIEDEADDLIGEVCLALTEGIVREQHVSCAKISQQALQIYNSLEEDTIHGLLNKVALHALIEEYSEEILEDLLLSTHFHLCVKAAVRRCFADYEEEILRTEVARRTMEYIASLPHMDAKASQSSFLESESGGNEEERNSETNTMDISDDDELTSSQHSEQSVPGQSSESQRETFDNSGFLVNTMVSWKRKAAECLGKIGFSKFKKNKTDND